jgi:hypothetical protein
MDVLAQFHYKITYRPGKENAIADILSQKDELTSTQKAAKEAERTRIVLSVEVILATAGGDEPVADLRVTKEVL